MDETEIERIVGELIQMPARTAMHRQAISEIAAKRRELAGQLVEQIGPTRAAQRLSISRQTLWQILNPDRAQSIKRKSLRSRRQDSGGPAENALD